MCGCHLAVYHLLVNRKIPRRLTSNKKLNKFEKNGRNKNEQIQKQVEMRPERPGTPFKRRAMENDVGLYQIYAFTTSMVQVWVQKALEQLQTYSKFGKII